MNIEEMWETVGQKQVNRRQTVSEIASPYDDDLFWCWRSFMYTSAWQTVMLLPKGVFFILWNNSKVYGVLV